MWIHCFRLLFSFLRVDSYVYLQVFGAGETADPAAVPRAVRRRLPSQRLGRLGAVQRGLWADWRPPEQDPDHRQ